MNITDTLSTIASERDPNVLWPYHYSDNDAEVMHAAANRIYELTEVKR